MKFTPLDIQRKDFEKILRGFDPNEVRAFLHQVASEWEELLHENSRLRDEVLDQRERLQQYQDQDRIFRETLLHAQRTKEELIEAANREKALLIKEADFKADEIVREAHQRLAELEAQMRSLKLERVRYLQEIEVLVNRTRRFLQEEAPEMFPSDSPSKLDEESFLHMERTLGRGVPPVTSQPR